MVIYWEKRHTKRAAALCIPGVSGTIGDDHSVRLEAEDGIGGGIIGNHRYVAAALIQLAHDALLDAAVDGYHIPLMVGRTREPTLLAADALDLVVA